MVDVMLKNDIGDAKLSTVKHQTKFEPHSGVEPGANVYQAPPSATSQNVTFLDQRPSYMYDVSSNSDPTRTQQDSDDADLGNFFSRPVKIHSEEWGTGTSLAFDIDPWNLYFTNPRVINRIANYKLLRADLHVKVVINGNGFHFGRALVNYLPLNQFDDLSSNAALIREDLVQASQQPHIFLDPTTSTGGEMKLPFFWHENYIDIVDGTWSQMGQLYFRDLNTLKHANGASDKVTITVFAWAENVSVNVLTSRNPILMTPQSGEEIDEANAKGIISGPATTMAQYSNALSVIPSIAPFAMATSQMATGVANMAKLLGYSRPPVTKNPEPMRIFPTSSLSVTNVPDTAQKLTLDDKQELTIDPRIAGLDPHDPLCIKTIAKKESYLTTYKWAIGTPPETLLWNTRVTPVTWAESSGTQTAYHFPACAMAALPFKYWTGSMTFRFQIVCSTFHKGRLKIVYDPDFLETSEYNTNYMEIIDIADKQDFAITVGNGQTVTLLDHHYPGKEAVSKIYSTTKFTNQDSGNGVLGVYVVNELTTPNSVANNDIEVNVFVSMGEDFEVFVPEPSFEKFVFKPQSGFEPQSGSEIIPDSQQTEEPSAPALTKSDTVGPGMQMSPLVNKVFTGESIVSFRQVLKRYSIHERFWFGSTANQARCIMNISRNGFPHLRGNVPGATHTTSAGNPYSYCNTLLLHWVTLAFQGWRGSIRRKLLPQGISTSSGDSFLYVQREPIYSEKSGYSQQIGIENTPTSATQCAYTIVRNDDALVGSQESKILGGAGMIYVNSSANHCAEFEVPYYSPYRFTPGKRADYTSPDQLSEGFSAYGMQPSDAQSKMDILAATGEDFQVYFWTGLPRVYYENAPPLPAA